jgi:large subunit ribosomal protein L28
MAKQCIFTGKRVTLGNQIVRRGKAKYLGGVGRKVTGISRRKFRPNLQKVRVELDGEVKRVWVSTSALRSGLVQKPRKRKLFEVGKNV